MTSSAVEHIANAILYEGYNLYPYRPSAIKNQHRWMFGVLYPKSYCAQNRADHWLAHTECLILGNENVHVDVNVRFLQLVGQHGAADDQRQNWHEVVDRSVTLNVQVKCPADQQKSFSFTASAGHSRAVHGIVHVTAECLDGDTKKLCVTVQNHTALELGECNDRDHALLHALVSTNTILSLHGGEFVSLLDPPSHLREAAAQCNNVGTWPVLAGDPQRRNVMLSSPIILYDYPRVAPESPGDMFDGTEIDELLALRVQTLTEDEKREMASADSRTRQMLERTQMLTEDQMLNLHGALRQTGVEPNTATTVNVGNAVIERGSRVRLRPKGRADAFDLVLSGMAATVESIEVDFEGKTHVAVTVDDDPGQDLGRQGKPGHRFFFRPEELEAIPKRRILVAGVGNIFCGDDAFGVEVAKRLSMKTWPDCVTVADFGIRGMDLGYALLDNYDVVILIDATQRGGIPGTLYLVEPDLSDESEDTELPLVEGHAMHLEKVLRWAKASGARLPDVRLVGCEPHRMGTDEDMIIGLSPRVQSTVNEAGELVERLVNEVLQQKSGATGCAVSISASRNWPP